MKKIFLSLTVFAALSSCKKETNIVENTATTKDSALVTESVKPTETVALKEFSNEKVSELLKAKPNDTVYVTNFFATWCGPCLREIPHFKEKMEELKAQPVKFTFVNMDEKSDWQTAVKKFGEENNLTKNIVLLDGANLTPDFYRANFKTWDGGSIPFTMIKKGDQTEEMIGMLSKEDLSGKINSFLAKNSTSK